ncbi:MAG: DUF1015 domain-containing protein [Clostridia bacterium]|nr:DUF1015 domain-containing protein [Clostridia bacterium]
MKKTVIAPEILLPNKSVDFKKWAVVACDQFTSEPKYWQELKEYVGTSQSALNVILPEVYLSKATDALIDGINATMNEYLSDGTFQSQGKGFILVERSTPVTVRRLGLVIAVDLEDYSFRREDHALIRATEGTVIERIPPRVRIRQHAPVELPHIMLLIDDRKCEIIEKLYENRDSYRLAYDSDLNMNGGHIRGWFIEQTDAIVEQLYKLISDAELLEKYGQKDESMLFAVGDGNHSLATAKACWDNVKQNLSEDEKKCHPARYAMVELENLHDSGLQFEPIHRAVFNVKPDFIEGLKKLEQGDYACKLIVKGSKPETLMLPSNAPTAVKLLQDYIDGYIKTHDGAEVDYVHGEGSLTEVVNNSQNAVGITLPPLQKNDLFDCVLKVGALPRKTFSMGEAFEKRYYVEARKITK